MHVEGFPAGLSTGLSAGDRAALDGRVARSADPGRVARLLGNLVEAAPAEAIAVLSTDAGRAALVALCAASRSLPGWLGTHPEELSELGSAHVIAPIPDASVLTSQVMADVAAAGDPAAALRRFRTRWFLRIAVRDLLSLATLAEVGRDLSALADTCLHAAVEVATEGNPDRLAVIGMGKHGGGELNYASDVDVLFVTPDGAPDESKLARRVLDLMAAPTPEGIVWRTDADLRPEGRNGPLTRTFGAYLAYYERWADTWEFQALIKRRAVAGNPGLADGFVTATERFVYPDVWPDGALDELRTMKARNEARIADAGLLEREVKLGPGGIRDVEFAVQLLQLVHGRRDPALRLPNTIAALGALANGGYVDHRDAETLSTSYIKLRSVEHRLQLDTEAQVHTLPTDGDTLERLGRLLGHRPDASGPAAQHFLDDFRADLATVRSVHERLYYRPLLETFARSSASRDSSALSDDAAAERLHAFGFADAAATRRALASLTSGLSRRSRLMAATLPVVLEWLSDTPDPDLGLLMLDRLTSQPHQAERLTAVWRESPQAAQRLCQVLGSSRPTAEGLIRFPELILALEDDRKLAARGRDDLYDEASRRLAWRDDQDERMAGLRRFVRRERVRIAIRDLLGFGSDAAIAAEWTALAEACLAAALDTAVQGHPEMQGVPVALIGMGRLGGAELMPGSDLDVLVVFDGGAAQRAGGGAIAAVEKVAANLIRTLGQPTGDGVAFEVDCDLRPEGKSGALARSLDAYVAYWARWAETWEFQAMVKARPVAGDVGLGAAFMDEAEPFVFADPFPPQRLGDIRMMKARIDRERLPAGADPAMHLKLGRGGLVDVEFAVQALQMQHGAAYPQVRRTQTAAAIAALVDAGLLGGPDAERLADAHAFVSRLRSRLTMLGVRDPNVFPAAHAEVVRAARLVGYTDDPAPSLREDYRRVTRRAHAASDRILYPDDQAAADAADSPR